MPTHTAPPPEYVIFASYGNDSIALIQWAAKRGLTEVAVAFSDTRWGSPAWMTRVDEAETWVRRLGFTPHRIASEGMEALVRRKKGWPRQGMQFCSYELKIKPAQAWLDEVDPDQEAVCLVGIRREEGLTAKSHRRTWPEWVEESDNHGGRALWSPLVRHDEVARDALIREAGYEPLPHRSMECAPCINANRADLRQLDEAQVARIEAFESSLGYTSNDKPRTMFRPYRHLGATGIREVVRWAKSDRGEYSPLVVLNEQGGGCDSGYCES